MSNIELYEGCYGLMRGGEVVGPFERRKHGVYPFKTLVNGSGEVFMKNGRFYYADGRKSVYDIIAVADSASELMTRSLALSGKVETPHYETATSENVKPGKVVKADLKPSDPKPLLVTDEQRDRLLRLIENEKPALTDHEHVSEDNPLGIYDGCYGLTRNGRVVGPIVRHGAGLYPLTITIGQSEFPYTLKGRFFHSFETDGDVIAVFPSKEAAEASRRAALENESAAEIWDSENAEGGQSDSAPRLDPAPPLDLKTGQWVKLHNGCILGPIDKHSDNVFSVTMSLRIFEMITIHRDDIAAVVEQPA